MPFINNRFGRRRRPLPSPTPTPAPEPPPPATLSVDARPRGGMTLNDLLTECSLTAREECGEDADENEVAQTALETFEYFMSHKDALDAALAQESPWIKLPDDFLERAARDHAVAAAVALATETPKPKQQPVVIHNHVDLSKMPRPVFHNHIDVEAPQVIVEAPARKTKEVEYLRDSNDRVIGAKVTEE